MGDTDYALGNQESVGGDAHGEPGPFNLSVLKAASFKSTSSSGVNLANSRSKQSTLCER
jgi:hypothetical protein